MNLRDMKALSLSSAFLSLQNRLFDFEACWRKLGVSELLFESQPSILFCLATPRRAEKALISGAEKTYLFQVDLSRAIINEPSSP
jgi:hypothetical protein